MIPFFKDAKIEHQFQEFGFVKFAQIDSKIIQQILDVNKKLNT